MPQSRSYIASSWIGSRNVTTGITEKIADILNGAADVGFASLAVYSPALDVTRLFEDELLLVVAHDHRLAKRSEATVTDLQSERLILFERGASIRRATDQFFDSVGIRPDLALESNDTYFIKLMVEHGLGISLLPSWAVRDEVESKKLAKLRIAGHSLNRSVSMVSLGKFQASSTRAFHRFILEHRVRLQEMASA